MEDPMGWKKAQMGPVVHLRCLKMGRVEIKAGGLQKGTSGTTQSVAKVGIYATDTYGVPTRCQAQSQVWGPEIARILLLQASSLQLMLPRLRYGI